jgi:hypothetical protein
MDWLDSDHVTHVSCDACLVLRYIRTKEGSKHLQVVAAEACKQEDISKLGSTEEYKKSACEDLMFDLKTLCVL